MTARKFSEIRSEQIDFMRRKCGGCGHTGSDHRPAASPWGPGCNRWGCGCTKSRKDLREERAESERRRTP